MATKRRKQAGPPAKTPEDLLEHVRDLAQKVPADKLGAALKKVAAARGLAGAELQLTFRQTDDPYYNVYRYAFFGMVPEKDTRMTTASAPAARTTRAKRARRKVSRRP